MLCFHSRRLPPAEHTIRTSTFAPRLVGDGVPAKSVVAPIGCRLLPRTTTASARSSRSCTTNRTEARQVKAHNTEKRSTSSSERATERVCFRQGVCASTTTTNGECVCVPTSPTWRCQRTRNRYFRIIKLAGRTSLSITPCSQYWHTCCCRKVSIKHASE